WNSRQNVISTTHIDEHGVARIVSFDDRRAFKAKENIACMSMPVPRDTFVGHEAQSRDSHVRSNCYVLQAVSALTRWLKIVRSHHCRLPWLWVSYVEDGQRCHLGMAFSL